eukprot:TRINITY_DN1286_c0_g1_i6.p2 TRINITY_DN1286_c0_g1~~TRINITY_DN1286_c0_g1_i6.p2  ORF type:complete len:142 (-),score=30.31 TRINITY_DN1286_c0_g1_i6:66-491(-)
MRVWMRPHWKEFLQAAFREYSVAFWSSSRAHRFEKLIKILLVSMGVCFNEPYFVWGQDKCQLVPVNKARVLTKPLSTVFQRFPALTPGNVFILDDSAQKIRISDKQFWLPVKPWDNSYFDTELQFPHGALWGRLPHSPDTS